MWKIQKYDRTRNLRLLLSIPVGIAVLVLILTSVERTRVVHRIFTVGYEGPTRLVPTITIIDEKGIESDVTMPEQHRMVAQNIVLQEGNPDEEKAKETSSTAEEEPEEPVFDDLSGTHDRRSQRTHAEVPYQEDYVILKMVKPEYPPEALEKGLEGYVVVEIFVGTDGAVSEAWVRSSYGDASFETASLDAVRQFLFRPITEEGSPIPFWVSFLITFRYQD
jgi:TonB family protein